MFTEQVLYKGEVYHLYLAEEEYITRPEDLGVRMVWPTIDPVEYKNTYCIDERNLVLQSMEIHTNTNNINITDINNIFPRIVEENNIKSVYYDDIALPLNYSGAIILLKDFMDKYGFESEYPCYCYRNVIELIFNEGCLITTIDHSRAMLKIRKNIDAGLRDPKVKKDIRCIERFIKSSFIGEYKIKNRRRSKNINIMRRLMQRKNKLI